MGRVPPVKPPDAVPGVVITPCKCDVMPGYARLNKHEASGEIRRTNKQKADNLRSMERKLDKQAASDQHTWENHSQNSHWTADGENTYRLFSEGLFDFHEMQIK